jgi:hypothetical protein
LHGKSGSVAHPPVHKSRSKTLSKAAPVSNGQRKPPDDATHEAGSAATRAKGEVIGHSNLSSSMVRLQSASAGGCNELPRPGRRRGVSHAALALAITL